VPNVAGLAALTRAAAPQLGVFLACRAEELGITARQLADLRSAGVVERAYPRVYCFTAVAPSAEQRLRAALAWAGPAASAAARSAGALYALSDVHAQQPEIVVPESLRARHPEIIVHHARHRSALMLRTVRGIPTTGPEATLQALAHVLDPVALEVACEDARRRRLTSVPALHRYLERFGARGRPGATRLRVLLTDLDPRWPSRSKLEVLTRRLLAEEGLTRFVREHPLIEGGQTFRYDFTFLRERVILETNGKRWHDDATDYQRDQHKWSIPARHGFRLVFATWSDVTEHPERFVAGLRAALTSIPVNRVPQTVPD
jgi:very-short-patch-repair endonuclease